METCLNDDRNRMYFMRNFLFTKAHRFLSSVVVVIVVLKVVVLVVVVEVIVW